MTRKEFSMSLEEYSFSSRLTFGNPSLKTGLTAVMSAPYFKSVLTFLSATFPPPATVHFLPRIFSIIGNISFPPTTLQPRPRSRL